MKRSSTKHQPVAVENLVPLPIAAKAADVSEQWLRILVQAGKVVGLKIGRNYVVDIESAKSFTRHPYLGRPRSAEKSPGSGGRKPRGSKSK